MARRVREVWLPCIPVPPDPSDLDCEERPGLLNLRGGCRPPKCPIANRIKFSSVKNRSLRSSSRAASSALGTPPARAPTRWSEEAGTATNGALRSLEALMLGLPELSPLLFECFLPDTLTSLGLSEMSRGQHWKNHSCGKPSGNRHCPRAWQPVREKPAPARPIGKPGFRPPSPNHCG